MDEIRSEIRGFLLGSILTSLLWLSAELIRTRAGKRPSSKKKRRHWPWDRNGGTGIEASLMTRPSRDGAEMKELMGEFRATEEGKKGNEIVWPSMRDEGTNKGKNAKEKVCIGSIFGLDIGGSLTKPVYFIVHPQNTENWEHRTRSTNKGPGLRRSKSAVGISKSNDQAAALERFYEFARGFKSNEKAKADKELSYYSKELGGEFHFILLESRAMLGVMELIKSSNFPTMINKIGATDGGAFKYADHMKSNLGIEMNKQEETDSLVAGMQFVLADVVGECYTFKPVHSKNTNQAANWTRKVRRDHLLSEKIYPYLLVIIGTGVSILRVDGPRKHRRVSGSSIGGGTYWGLCRLLTDVETFEDVMNLAARGNTSKVDMLVGDIYGKESNTVEKLGLPGHVVASSFGKLVAKQDPASDLKQEDLARALLQMITNNIGQVAFFNALMHDTSSIFFVGNFLRHNDVSQKRLSYAINYWSKGQKEALFLEHEGYFGALGAFLLGQGIEHSGAMYNTKRSKQKRKG